MPGSDETVSLIAEVSIAQAMRDFFISQNTRIISHVL